MLLPLTTSNIHLALIFNYKEPVVQGLKQETGVDYVFGASGERAHATTNIRGRGGAWHEYYISWPRNASAGAWRSISWFRANHPDWLLYRSNRTTVPIAYGDNNAPLDFTNRAVQQYIITNWINPALAGGFQGISIDNGVVFNYLGAAGHYDIHHTWVQQYSGNFSDPVYARAQETALHQIVAAVHAAHPHVTVTLNQGDDCNEDQSTMLLAYNDADMILSEAGFVNSANSTMPYIAQYSNQYCPAGKWRQVVDAYVHLQRDLGKGLILDNQEPYTVSAHMTDTNARARFDLQWALANYLLVKYAHTYFWWGGKQQYGYPALWQREYSAPIGSPTTGFYRYQNVYLRNYSNGLAMVNPALSTSYTVTLPSGTYQDLYGRAIDTTTMPPHSGMVLLRTRQAGKTPTAVKRSITPTATPTRPPSRSPTATRTTLPLRPTPPLKPGATPTRTLPPATRTIAPTAPSATPNVPSRVAIDKVQILRRFKGHLSNTRVLYRGEKATFLVLYHLGTPAPRLPAATLLITQHGKIIRLVPLAPRLVHGHRGFARTFVLGKGLVGKFWTHFLLHMGSTYVERDRRLTIVVRHPAVALKR